MPLPPEEIGRRIRKVREEVGVSQTTLAQALDASTQEVERLESGTLKPIPGDYILIISQILQTDFRYFISNTLDDVELEVRKLFRALAAPTPQDLLSLRRFILFSTSESELEEILGIKKPPLPTPYPSKDNYYWKQGQSAAIKERDRLRLGIKPIENIFQLIRSQGIGLTRQRLQDSNLSGTTLLHPRAGVYVLVNYDDDLYRQFFSAAHEYCHALFDRNHLKKEGCVVSYHHLKKDPIETRANSFAAEFLLPLNALNQYSHPKTKDDVIALTLKIGRDYKVNTETVAIRMKHKDWISQRTVDSFRQVRPAVISRREKSDPEMPAGLTEQQARRRQTAMEQGVSTYYLELLRRALIENQISLNRFAEMIDMSPQQAMDFIAETGLAL